MVDDNRPCATTDPNARDTEYRQDHMAFGIV